jgi:hypothetical protein
MKGKLDNNAKKRVQEGKNQGRPYRGHMRFHLSLLLLAKKDHLTSNPFFLSLPPNLALSWLSSCASLLADHHPYEIFPFEKMKKEKKRKGKRKGKREK